MKPWQLVCIFMSAHKYPSVVKGAEYHLLPYSQAIAFFPFSTFLSSLSVFIFSLSPFFPPVSAESEIEQRGDCIRALMWDRVEGETKRWQEGLWGRVGVTCVLCGNWRTGEMWGFQTTHDLSHSFSLPLTHTCQCSNNLEGHGAFTQSINLD